MKESSSINKKSIIKKLILLLIIILCILSYIFIPAINKQLNTIFQCITAQVPLRLKGSPYTEPDLWQGSAQAVPCS